MDYTSIHIYGHLLSDDILYGVEHDTNLLGNRQQDFGLDISTSAAIDYVWSSLRNDWRFFNERSGVNDPYGTRRSRDLIERLLQNLGYSLNRQNANLIVAGSTFEISYLCSDLGYMPVIVVGDKIIGENGFETLDKCSLDYRAKGARRRRSPHATMLEYLNATENVYGIISNGITLRLIRNSGQLVKLTYIEFDLRRMLEEDKYSEFCLMFRLLHASRFRTSGDEPCVMERWFNMSIESGNRIREGLSKAVQRAMEVMGNAALCTVGTGNDVLRADLAEGKLTDTAFNKELIHFIYRLLFLFIIEDRGLVYQLPDSPDAPDYAKICRWQEIYKANYAASRLRHLSELRYLRQKQYYDLWLGLVDTFRLFETGGFGEQLGIKPLGGMLFDSDTLHYLRSCTISNKDLLEAFDALNKFTDENGQPVKINYSSLDVEEFGSVYEGILEMRPFVQSGAAPADWQFDFVGGLDRKSTSSYYTRPDLVQNLIRTTLEPVIKERIAKCKTTEEKVRSLLSMKVCDAASGSGHIVLAMARTIAWYVCMLRTGEDNPASLDYRQALREVIQKCVYAVDYNPDAVELCKVVLWIEGYCAGKPLSFLDYHIRCGNSVVGVADLDTLLDGVPKEAFSADDKEVKKQVIILNKKALDDVQLVQNGKKQGMNVSLFTSDFTMQSIDSEQVGLANKVREIAALPEDTLEQQVIKQHRWEDLMRSPRVECLRLACDIYTYAFYKQFTSSDIESHVDESGKFTAFSIPYTRTVYQALQEIKNLDDPDDEPDAQHLPDTLRREAADSAADHRYFHWCVEFPEVFAYDGGFDVMCGNPPWDKLQMEEEKWFAGKDEDIVNAPNQAARKKRIAALEQSNPSLYAEFIAAGQSIASESSFVKNSGRFPLTAVGKLELSSLFAELCLSFSKETWGLVLPTGIAVNDSNKAFFSRLVAENRLQCLYSFENEEKLFPIHHSFKFCLLICGKAQKEPRTVSGGFYLRRIDHLLDPNRIYTLRTDDFALLNPNTKTCPVFRTSRDAMLTTKIYHRCKVLMNDVTGENPWKIKFGSMFNMSTDSHLFRTYAQLTGAGAEYQAPNFILNGDTYMPLYEGKMIWLYNHHYGTWPTLGERPNTISTPPLLEFANPNSHIMPWYWVPLSEVDNSLVKNDKDGNVIWEWKHRWLIGFRDITSSITERTFILSPIPNACGVGHSTTLLFEECGAMPGAVLIAMLSSIPFDYITKQKIGGSHASIGFVKQFPVLTFDKISDAIKPDIIERVAELCYFNHDLDGWMCELWYDEEMTDDIRTDLLVRLAECNNLNFDSGQLATPDFSLMSPFIYNEERRAVAQAELDAIFAHLYGLTTEELHYILDPEDVCGKGCINETFRVLRDNEIRQYGEYRTKRLVLEAWNRFNFEK